MMVSLAPFCLAIFRTKAGNDGWEWSFQLFTLRCY